MMRHAVIYLRNLIEKKQRTIYFVRKDFLLWGGQNFLASYVMRCIWIMKKHSLLLIKCALLDQTHFTSTQQRHIFVVEAGENDKLTFGSRPNALA
jgi:hypothetical protein